MLILARSLPPFLLPLSCPPSPSSSLPPVFSFLFSSIKFLGWFCRTCLFLFFEMMAFFCNPHSPGNPLLLPQLSECCGQKVVSPYLVSSSFFTVQYTEWKPSACLHWIQQEPSCRDSGVFGNVYSLFSCTHKQFKLLYKMYQGNVYISQSNFKTDCLLEQLQSYISVICICLRYWLFLIVFLTSLVQHIL